MMAVLKGVEGDRHMDHPVGGDVHKVDVVPVAELLISLRTQIVVCRRQPCLLEYILAYVQTLLL